MGIYSMKFMESAVAQDPENVGVDLDAVANAIAGDDGNESYRDDIEAAETGLVGDPVDEAFVIMFESTYNFNQLMECIGISELREAYKGRDFILEGANLDAFIDKVKKVLLRMFEEFTKAYHKVCVELEKATNVDRKFVTKYKKQILAGADTDWEYDGFKFPNPVIYTAKAMSGENDLVAKCKQNLVKASEYNKDSDANLDRVAIIERNTDGIVKVDAADSKMLKSMVTILKNYYYTGDAKNEEPEKVKLNKSSNLADSVIKVLEGTRETAEIKAAYSVVKAAYKKAIDGIEMLKKNLKNNAEETDSVAMAAFICKQYTEAIIFEKNVQNTVYNIALGAARAKRAQFRRLAHMWYSIGAKAEKAKQKGVENDSVAESFTFANITLI